MLNAGNARAAPLPLSGERIHISPENGYPDAVEADGTEYSHYGPNESCSSFEHLGVRWRGLSLRGGHFGGDENMKAFGVERRHPSWRMPKWLLRVLTIVGFLVMAWAIWRFTLTH